MTNNYDVKVEPPKSYNKNEINEINEIKNLVNEIPDNQKKVKKMVIKGVIRHDTASN